MLYSGMLAGVILGLLYIHIYIFYYPLRFVGFFKDTFLDFSSSVPKEQITLSIRKQLDIKKRHKVLMSK